MNKNNSILRYGNLTKYYGMKTRGLKIPFFGTFELTPLCNMNCKMCYIRMTQEEMNKVGKELPVEEWIRIAQEAVNEGMVMALLTGGEALLYKGFKQFYLALRKMGVSVSVNTNGTLFNDSWIEFFKENPPSKFNITLYGGSNETYERLCGNPKGFDQITHTIEKLKENNIEILLNCTITKQNVQDMDAMFAFAHKHNLQIHVTTYNFPPVRKEGVDAPILNRLTPYEAARARLKLNWESINNKEKFLKRANETITNVSQVESLENQCVDIVGDKVLCAAGRSNFWVTWDGRILPCGMLPDWSVQIRDNNFKDVWNEVVKYTETILLAPECKNCAKKNLCKPCAAKLKSETGYYDKKAEYMCEYTDEYVRLMGEAKKYLENE